MGKVIAVGEALVDFIATDADKKLSDVTGFRKEAGGAPANVAACVSRLSGNGKIITKLGLDAFGDFLEDKMRDAGTDVGSVLRTDAANTALAFVSLKKDGERDFAFYRNPSADMLLTADEIQAEWFEKDDILHFCSVMLVSSSLRRAHDKAIAFAKEKGALVSFDPNVRLPLWKDKNEYRKIINEYIGYADILKVSDDEIGFITGCENKEVAAKRLAERVKLFVFTKGADGASVYYGGKVISHSGFKVKAVDTTGAGDAFIGSFLAQIIKNNKNNLTFTEDELLEMLKFSNAAAARVTTRKGALGSMPTADEVENFIKERARYYE